MGKTKDLGHLAHIVEYDAENHITVPAGITMHTNQLVASQAYVTTALGSYALSSALGSYVPTSRTITINGTTYDLSANREWNITSMIYPAAGIALSTGTAWGESITNNSGNWNTAFGWGNHASAGYLTGITSTQVTTALGFTPYNATNPSGYITGISFANVSSKPTTLSGYGITDAVPSTRTITINGTAFDLSANRSWTITATETDTLATVTARGATTTAAITTGVLTVNTGGTGTWGPFVVTSTSQWGDGATQYVTIGAGGAAGIMINNPHIVWNTSEGAAAAKYGRSGGISSGAYYVAGTGASDNFFITKNGALASPQLNINSSGNATFSGTLSASNLSGTNTGDSTSVYARGQSNWNDSTVINNVVGMLSWKNYGNGHVIFDASQGTSPSGGGVNQTNATYGWTASYPTLMGWNGSGTYGVRVDSARVADSAGSVTNGVYTNTTNNLSGFLNLGSSGTTPYASPTGTSNGIAFGGVENSSLRTYGIFTEQENIGGNYSKLTINYHTGIRIGAFPSYGGTRFYNNFAGGSGGGSEIFSIGNGDSNIRAAATIYAAGYRGNANVGGTGEATWHPAGIYCGGTMWQYGGMYKNNTWIYDLGGIEMTSVIRRKSHASGFFEGSYNNVGGNSANTNPIYTIGSNYNPSDTSLNSMYGIGYAHPNLWGGGKTSSWGLYVANGGAINVTLGEGATSIWAQNDIVAYSDIRVKDNIEVIENALEKIQAIRGVTFTRKDATPADSGKRHAGVIAQEVLAVLPEVVSGTEDDMYSVAYGNMAGLFIEAFKEQQKQIEELKNIINGITR